jgi:phosphoesterase RecJ-like protein
MEALYDELIDRLTRCQRVLLTTHVRPDGDALGSVAAVALALRRQNILADVLLLSHLPRKYAFVFEDAGVRHHDAEREWPEAIDPARYDAILVCDTGTWSQLPGLRERIEALAVPKLVLDHHLTQEDWADLKVVDASAGATGEMVLTLLRRWSIAVDSTIASALFVAIATDTGWFQFSNTTPWTMRAAADLMETGIDTDRLYQLCSQNERPARLRLQAVAMRSLELLHDDRVAVMILTRDGFAAAGAAVTDTENLVNIPLQVRQVEVSVLICEDPSNGTTRVSLRSKGQVNCAELAGLFGGGGHARAAGAKFEQPALIVRERLLSEIVPRLV